MDILLQLVAIESAFDDGSFILYEDHFQHIINKGVNFPIPNVSEDMIYTKLKTLSEDIVLLKCARAFSTHISYLFNKR